MHLSTLFEGYELGEVSTATEFRDLLSGRSDADAMLAIGVVRALFAELDRSRH